MLVKFVMSGGYNKTLNEVYKEMVSSHKNKSFYDGLYNNFIKDILGYKSIKNLTSNDIDYFYMYLKLINFLFLLLIHFVDIDANIILLLNYQHQIFEDTLYFVLY